MVKQVLTIKHPEWKSERGATLLEMVLVIILLGIALPSLLAVTGLVSFHASKNSVVEQAVQLAESKMEEIIGWKMKHWDWYKHVNGIQRTENLPNGFQRRVQVRHINGWGSAGMEAWEVTVIVEHPELEDGYVITTRLTRYY